MDTDTAGPARVDDEVTGFSSASSGVYDAASPADVVEETVVGDEVTDSSSASSGVYDTAGPARVDNELTDPPYDTAGPAGPATASTGTVVYDTAGPASSPADVPEPAPGSGDHALPTNQSPMTQLEDGGPGPEPFQPYASVLRSSPVFLQEPEEFDI